MREETRSIRQFDSGGTNLEDEHRSGRPVTESTKTTRDRIENIILTNHRIKIREIADELALTKSVVGRIVQNELKFRKFYARWVPKELTSEHTGQAL